LAREDDPGRMARGLRGPAGTGQRGTRDPICCARRSISVTVPSTFVWSDSAGVFRSSRPADSCSAGPFPASISPMLIQTISRRLRGITRALALAAVLLGAAGTLASAAEAARPYQTPQAQAARATAAHKKHKPAPKRK